MQRSGPFLVMASVLLSGVVPRAIWNVFGLYLLLSALLPLPAAAHLSIIRQGAESAGSLESDDATGSALAAGDFDGDGYEDLAIGAPGEVVSGQTAAGAVVIVYGSEVGLTHTGADYRTAGSTGGTNIAFAEFGHALAAGYFDSDSYADLAIGDPFETVGAVDDAGRVYILYGSAAGLAITAALILDQSDGGGSIEMGDRFGEALAAGDFDGDGRDDLAIGAPGEDADAGAVFHFYGSAAGITTTGAGFFKQSSLGGTNVSGDRFGSALAAGRLCGTTAHDDLAAGAYSRAVGPATDAGVVYLIQGSGSGLTSASARQYSAADLDAAQTSGRFGYALAVGQLVSGTYEWLSIGEPQHTVSARTNAGRVISIPGANAGLDWASARVNNQGTGGTVIDTGDSFGLALAAGDWNDDGLDDLAVASPFENVGISSDAGSLTDAGMVQIFLGTDALVSFSTADSLTLIQHALFDTSETNDHLGMAVAFGRFDDSGRASLAAGAPGEDTSSDIVLDASNNDVEEFNDAGGVYIVAPWRQPKAGGDIPCRNSVATDCNGNLVFSQRPFDRVRPASTTKVMTLLLACEAIQAGTADSSFVYDVLAWVAGIGGTTQDMVAGEQSTLMDIMYYTIIQSGNDGAYAIADIISYAGVRGSNDISDFIELMNARASLLGMTRTQFSNPAGRDAPEDPAAVPQDNYTTPDDMARLGRAAMQNSLFREIVSWTRRVYVTNRGAARPATRTYTRGFITNLQAVMPEANGIKTGGTTRAGRSRLASAQTPLLGLVVAGMYAIHPSIPSSNGLYPTLAELLKLGFRRCDPAFAGLPPLVMPEGPLVRLDNVSTESGSQSGGGIEIDGRGNDSLMVEVTRQSGSGPAAFHLDVTRESIATLAPGVTAEYGLEPFQSHQGFQIVNANDVSATLAITLSHPPGQGSFVLAPYEALALPSYTGPLSTSFSMTIQNVSAQILALEVSERGYGFDATLNPGAPGNRFVVQMHPHDRSQPHEMLATITGYDMNPGNEVILVIRRTSGIVSGVGDLEPGLGDPPFFRIEQVGPNPFRDQVQFVFHLDRTGSVEALVWDLQGRVVHRYFTVAAGPGRIRFQWDGRNPWSQRLGSGVYFYRFQVDGRPVGRGRLVLRR